MMDITRFLELSGLCKQGVYYEGEMTSTSDRAKELALAGAASGTLVITDYQTAGRGRGGNVWRCEAGEGLLFSLVIEPDIEPSLWYRFSLAVGVAIAISLEEYGLKVGVKWPNDLLINGKKFAGILVEVLADRVIVGVGINVSGMRFSSEIERRATSLLLAGASIQREELLARLVNNIFRWGSLCGEAFPRVVDEVNRRCVLKGREVSMISRGEKISGVVKTISPQGFLMLEVDGEVVDIIEAKEINGDFLQLR